MYKPRHINIPLSKENVNQKVYQILDFKVNVINLQPKQKTGLKCKKFITFINVVKGKGVVKIGSKNYGLCPGNFFVIPHNKEFSIKNTSSKYMFVYSTCTCPHSN